MNICCMHSSGNGIRKKAIACDIVWLLIALPCNHFIQSNSRSSSNAAQIYIIEWKSPINLKDMHCFWREKYWFTHSRRRSFIFDIFITFHIGYLFVSFFLLLTLKFPFSFSLYIDFMFIKWMFTNVFRAERTSKEEW